MAIDENHAGAGDLSKRRRLQQAFNILGSSIDGLARRIGLINKLAQIGPTPVLHLAMGQRMTQCQFGRGFLDSHVHAASLSNWA